jgi:nickel-type superoxide dismutase maturation protease
MCADPHGCVHWPIWRAKVTERSMEPALRPGDCLLIRRTRRIRPGQVVVARHPDRPEMLLVKRAARRAVGGWWLESDNPGAGAVDSRRFGAVPRSLIEGRVLIRYWRARSLPPNGPGIRPRTRERPRQAAGPFAVSCDVSGGGRAEVLTLRPAC